MCLWTHEVKVDLLLLNSDSDGTAWLALFQDASQNVYLSVDKWYLLKNISSLIWRKCFRVINCTDLFFPTKLDCGKCRTCTRLLILVFRFHNDLNCPHMAYCTFKVIIISSPTNFVWKTVSELVGNLTQVKAVGCMQKFWKVVFGMFLDHHWIIMNAS